MDTLKAKLKELIIEALMIEDMVPSEIGDEMVLFGEGLGLDSIDALELAVEIERVFGVAFPEDARTRDVFSNITTLATYIRQRQTAEA